MHSFDIRSGYFDATGRAQRRYGGNSYWRVVCDQAAKLHAPDVVVSNEDPVN